MVLQSLICKWVETQGQGRSSPNQDAPVFMAFGKIALSAAAFLRCSTKNQQ
jgi:hypothetical protein